jgi:glutathione S-transferase
MTGCTLYGFPQSTYVRTARMALDEKGVPYALEALLPGAPELKALHPFGRIPAFRHGDLILFETLAIARYVDEAFPGPPLQPDDVVARAVMTQWVSAIIDSVYPSLVRDYLLIYIRARMTGGEPDRTRIDAALPGMERAFEVLEHRLSEAPFLAGEAMTLADLFLLPIMDYMRAMPESAGLLPGFARLGAWQDRVGERHSARTTAPPPMPGD